MLVLLVLLTCQLVFLVPSLSQEHRSDYSNNLSSQQFLLSLAIRTAYSQGQIPTQEIFNADVLGLTLVDNEGEIVTSFGDAPRTSAWLLPSGVKIPSDSSNYIDQVLSVQGGGEVLTALVRFDLSALQQRFILKSIVSVLLVLLVSIVGAAVALLSVSKFYIMPIENLLTAMRESREKAKKSESGIPEPIQFKESVDIDPLADEFNNVVEGQKNADRQVKLKQQYLEFAAHHDKLTHLPNRSLFDESLKESIEEAIETKSKFSVFIVDLDNFKYFNDQYGHLFGDKMLAEAGNRLRLMMGDHDVVARLNGDEFVVIQKNVTSTATAIETAERIKKLVAAPFEHRGFSVKTSVSIGISSYPQDVNNSEGLDMMSEELVNSASVALQESKTNGKNQYQIFNESMRSRLTERLELEQDIKLALQDKQLEVYFQPKVNMATGQVIGSEALVRWNHPTKGHISPELFVPVAEDAGMIVELGEWVLRAACKATHALHEAGHTGINVAVNISAVQFRDRNLLQLVNKALQDTQLNPEYLELEITESAVMHDRKEVISNLHKLKKSGLTLAIDDFGTGYSSLAYMKHFPVDTLKIDRAFITDIAEGNDDAAIVKAVIGLGKHFGMKVVAEGIENEEQLLLLKEQGCDIAQGFYISEPKNLRAYTQWLEEWPYSAEGAPEDEQPALPKASGADFP